MAIVYIAAEAMELKAFAARLEGFRKLNWPLDYAAEGILDGRRVLLVANGAGFDLAGRALETAIRALALADLSSSKLEAIVSTGFCGGLAPELRHGSIVVAEAVRGPEGEPLRCEVPAGLPEDAAIGLVQSQDRVIDTAEEKARLHASGALAADMESAALLGRAAKEKIPFYCIRAVSDTASESFFVDLNAMRTRDGRIARGKIVVYGLLRPALWPKLWGLKTRADEAAARLGEFLVSCRIQPQHDPAVTL